MGDMTEPTAYHFHLRGERIELTDDEAKAIRETLVQQAVDRMRVEQESARAAGWVWYAVYLRHHLRYEDEFFSLAEAAGYLAWGDGDGSQWGEEIRCPDGVTYKRADIPDGLTWSSLPALAD